MRRRERMVHGGVASEHIVQLFDTPTSLAETLSAFLHEGMSEGDTLLVVITPTHWEITAEHLERRGCVVADAVAAGHLVVRDAAGTLATCMRDGRPDTESFEACVGALVRSLGADGAGVRVYGEMVDLLAREGDFKGARQLEDFWNDLALRASFTLLCGYLAHHFGDPRSGPALDQICRSHGLVHNKPSDRLSGWLLAARPAHDRREDDLPLA